jgi:drug/metabolite transporter (DMT)-like permease
MFDFVQKSTANKGLAAIAFAIFIVILSGFYSAFVLDDFRVGFFLLLAGGFFWASAYLVVRHKKETKLLTPPTAVVNRDN